MLKPSYRWHKCAHLELVCQKLLRPQLCSWILSIRFAVFRLFSCFYLHSSGINMEQRAREESLQAKSILLIFYCVCKLCSSTDICVSESERYESARTRERSENGQKHTDTVCVCVCLEGSQTKVNSTQNTQAFSQTDPSAPTLQCHSEFSLPHSGRRHFVLR